MSQSNILIGNRNKIIALTEETKPVAKILKSYLDKSYSNPISILFIDSKKITNSKIYLKITSNINECPKNNFIIKSDSKNIYLIAPSVKELRYAVYTLLENWGFRKFTSTENNIPCQEVFAFSKNKNELHQPSFEYRALFYPDCYDEAFRDWHKLDWHLNDFGIWGHSFNKLLPPKTFFKTNPEYFALYEGKYKGESLCMTNDKVLALVIKKMEEIIAKKPNAKFYSVSQNDDIIYCECENCKILNKKHGGPQGSLYYFLNKIAAHFPNTKIITLAYLHTFNPPVGFKIASNIYTMLCPIELNRGKAIANKSALEKTLQNWKAVNPNIYLWDYTVQFSNYLSPFPNIHTFAKNYKLFKKNKVKGLFVQGYADVPGDFTELRQYLLAKLLWNTEIDIEATTDDFLCGFYGKAESSIRKYLNLLTVNQQKKDKYLDIYSGPLQTRKTFLTPEAINEYDLLLNAASIEVEDNPVLTTRVNKLRLALEFVNFEQSKYYGTDQNGMFVINEMGQKEVKKGLTERVQKFVSLCNKLGIYELSEGGLTPNQYYDEWLEITKNNVIHLGENLKVNFLSTPSEEYSGKGEQGLVDGIRGYKDFEINWIGWYENNPEIELITNKLKYNQIQLNFLNDQRHLIFLPKKISIFGFKNKKWELLSEDVLDPITEDYTVERISWKKNNPKFSSFTNIKLVIHNQDNLPEWRKRKFKKPMVMMDEIELYNN